jgi:tocopherol O-methyltransferase
LTPTDTKEKAQVQLIELLLERSALPKGSTVLDVGCGIGGTTRHLAKEHGCNVFGVTISGKQVEIARRLTLEEIKDSTNKPESADGAIKFGDGSVRFLELDAEKMGDFFTTAPNQATFDCIWISEAMSHLPNKKLFFQNAAKLLNPDGKLVVADWFKSEGLTEQQWTTDISPIEGQYCVIFGDVGGLTLCRWDAPPSSLQPGRLYSSSGRGWTEEICRTI